MQRLRAFTLLELLVVTAVIGLLAGLVLPAISHSKELGRRTSCRSNLRQLHLSLQLYADDHEGFYPARLADRRWPSQLERYYGDRRILLCPSSVDVAGSSDSSLTEVADRAPRAFVLNGFSNPTAVNQAAENWTAFLSGQARAGIKESAIARPADTIVFGERIAALDAFYADVHGQAGSFVEVVDQTRHGKTARPSAKAGGSNFAFADGSVRFLGYGKSMCPVNLWGVTDYYRTNYALCFF